MLRSGHRLWHRLSARFGVDGETETVGDHPLAPTDTAEPNPQRTSALTLR